MPLFGRPNVRRLAHRRDLGRLVKALQYKDASVREEAASWLGIVGGAGAVEPLIAALSDEEHKVRRQAAESLGHLGDDRAVEPLIAALSDEEHGVRLYAAESLGHLGADRAVEPLIAFLRSQEDGFHYSTARKALQSLYLRLKGSQEGERAQRAAMAEDDRREAEEKRLKAAEERLKYYPDDSTNRQIIDWLRGHTGNYCTYSYDTTTTHGDWDDYSEHYHELGQGKMVESSDRGFCLPAVKGGTQYIRLTAPRRTGRPADDIDVFLLEISNKKISWQTKYSFEHTTFWVEVQ